MNDRTVFVDNDEFNLDLEKIGEALGADDMRVIVPSGTTVGSKSTKRAAIRTGSARQGLSPITQLRSRISSRASGTSQAIENLSPRTALPAKPSSRRKAGAETIDALSPRLRLSPRTSAPARPAGRARRAVSPLVRVRGQSSQPVGQSRNDTQLSCADGPIESGGVDQRLYVTHEVLSLAAAIDEIREQWKRRQMWHRAEKSLTLQAKSMCRRLLAGDKKEAEGLYKSAMNGGEHEMAATAYLAMHPLIEARKGIETARLQVEKRLLVLAKDMPVADWTEGVRGVGLLSIAGIVGEAGDLGNYSNPAKLWKRMGLAVIGGERQRKKEGAAGIEHGYNPARRSLMWTIGDCIIRAGGPLKELYNERKVYEAPRVKTKMHAHNRAKRYIEKRLLRDLWRAWRAATTALSPRSTMPPSDL